MSYARVWIIECDEPECTVGALPATIDSPPEGWASDGRSRHLCPTHAANGEAADGEAVASE